MTRRLLLSYLSLTLLVLLALEVPLGVMSARGETDRFLSNTHRGAIVLADSAQEAIDGGNLAKVPQMLATFAHDTDSRAIVVDSHGTVLARSDSGAAGTDLSGSPDIATALKNQLNYGKRTNQDDVDELYLTLPTTFHDRVRGALQITFPAATVQHRIMRVWLILGAVGLVVLVVVGGLAVGLARWMTRPIRELERATTQLASGTFDRPPAPRRGPPEMRRLTAAFTETACQLQHLIESQRAFAAEASHQLKTPLTALRLRLENLEPDLDPRGYDSLDQGLAEIDRLARMVHGLLALATMEHTANERVSIDLDAVIADRALSWAPFAGEQGVRLTVAGRAVGKVEAATGTLEQILDNLLANALRAAPAHSTITIDLRVVTDGVEIHVIDQGAGMSATDRQRAFERFWRAPDACDDGSGLGLAIVAQLVRSNGGYVTLDAAPVSGIDAVVHLPAPVVETTHRAQQTEIAPAVPQRQRARAAT